MSYAAGAPPLGIRLGIGTRLDGRMPVLGAFGVTASDPSSEDDLSPALPSYQSRLYMHDLHMPAFLHFLTAEEPQTFQLHPVHITDF